ALQLALRVLAERVGRLDVAKRHRHLHWHPPASSAQNGCLRFEEGRIPIISRYFATVRRAMSTFSLPSISAMYWSLYGWRASSAWMISRIRCLTLSEETSSPPPARRLEVKKNLSSTVPCGVCTYLPEVARLTVDSCMPMSFATSFSTRGLSPAMP